MDSIRPGTVSRSGLIEYFPKIIWSSDHSSNNCQKNSAKHSPKRKFNLRVTRKKLFFGTGQASLIPRDNPKPLSYFLYSSKQLPTEGLNLKISSFEEHAPLGILIKIA